MRIPHYGVSSGLRWGGAGVLLYEKQVPCLPLSSPPIFKLSHYQNVEGIAAYAKEMSDSLMESEVTETKSFIRSFVKEITVRPGSAVIHYAIPTSLDNDIDGADIAEVALSRRVMKSAMGDGPCVERHYDLVVSRLE